MHLIELLQKPFLSSDLHINFWPSCGVSSVAASVEMGDECWCVMSCRGVRGDVVGGRWEEIGVETEGMAVVDVDDDVGNTAAGDGEGNGDNGVDGDGDGDAIFWGGEWERARMLGYSVWGGVGRRGAGAEGLGGRGGGRVSILGGGRGKRGAEVGGSGKRGTEVEGRGRRRGGVGRGRGGLGIGRVGGGGERCLGFDVYEYEKGKDVGNDDSDVLVSWLLVGTEDRDISFGDIIKGFWDCEDMSEESGLGLLLWDASGWDVSLFSST